VRVVCATHRNLPEMVEAGDFREDLMYRIKVVHLHVHPLRDRMEDLVPLVRHLVQRTGRPIRFTDSAIEYLASYHWPGNIRELHNVVEQVSWTAAGDTIDASDLQVVVPLSAPRPHREGPPRLADTLYDALRGGSLTFWGDVYPRFLRRDMTRDDLRELVGRGLLDAGGNYRMLLPIFGIADRDYKRFLNFLQAHDCALDFRSFRSSRAAGSSSGDA
jgi:hypothetical protein